MLLKNNRVLSLLLTEITLVMLSSGYAMTFIGVDIPVLRIIHFLFDILFSLTITGHMIINTFILGFHWRPVLISIRTGKADNITKIRLVQRLSSLGLIVTAVLQVISGLDWFKLGLSRLLPYPLHRDIDLVLFLFLIIHLSIAAYFYQLRKRIQKKDEPHIVNQERRNVISIISGAVIAFIAALYLDAPPKIGNSVIGHQGELPPGQSEIERLKVLHTGTGIPPWDPDTWRFEVTGNIENPLSFSWEEFRALSSIIRVADFHCVTGWTKFNNKWEGVSFQHIVEFAQLKPNARFATIDCLRGYTTSLPVVDLSRDDVLFAYRLDDKDLPREHGGPLRLVVPQKYGYKSAKWVFRVKFTEFQELGYWEMRGYSNTANPFINDRYSTSRGDNLPQ